MFVGRYQIAIPLGEELKVIIENTLISESMGEVEDASISVSIEEGISTDEVRESWDLKSLMMEICMDAKSDPLHYLLRSNTHHDGE